MEEVALIDYLESEQFVKAATSSSRIVEKLKRAIRAQELYEIHQILRTIYFRFSNSKEKVEALRDLLYQGSCYLLQLNEFTSGQDIGTLFLETAAKFLQNYRVDNGKAAELNLINSSLNHHVANRTLDWEISRRVANIATSLPDTEIGLTKFVSESLKVLTPKILNRDILHEVLAKNFWQHKDYINSRYHYLYCANLENAQDIAMLLVEHQTGSACKSEIDLFITQFILHLLCLQSPIDTPKQPNQKTVSPASLTVGKKTRNNIKTVAEKIFSSYTLNHPQLNQVCVPFSSLPLLNFTYFIISILDAQHESSTFKMLCDIYKVTWTRDPNYSSYLTRIGTLYFGVTDQSKQRQGGILNNILLSLLEGTDEEEEDSNQEGNNLSSSDELD